LKVSAGKGKAVIFVVEERYKENEANSTRELPYQKDGITV